MPSVIWRGCCSASAARAERLTKDDVIRARANRTAQCTSAQLKPRSQRCMTRVRTLQAKSLCSSRVSDGRSLYCRAETPSRSARGPLSEPRSERQGVRQVDCFDWHRNIVPYKQVFQTSTSVLAHRLKFIRGSRRGGFVADRLGSGSKRQSRSFSTASTVDQLVASRSCSMSLS